MSRIITAAFLAIYNHMKSGSGKMSLQYAHSALADALKAISASSNWNKGYLRQAQALLTLGQWQQAADAANEGIKNSLVLHNTSSERVEDPTLVALRDLKNRAESEEKRAKESKKHTFNMNANNNSTHNSVKASSTQRKPSKNRKMILSFNDEEEEYKASVIFEV